LSSKLTVIPGYLPLKLNIIQSMTSGADLITHISQLCQDVGDYSIVHNFNDPKGTITDSDCTRQRTLSTQRNHIYETWLNKTVQ